MVDRNTKSFIEHPFWTQYLGISNYLPSDLNKTEQLKLLKLTVEGFMPISYFSFYSFNAYYRFAGETEAGKVARYIAEVENGDHPLLAGGIYKGVPHYQMLNRCIASLANNRIFHLHDPDTYDFFYDINSVPINHLASLVYCNHIEETAPFVINYYQDFVAKWQSLYKIPSQTIYRVYLDEHNLTEGDESEDQHVNMIQVMNEPFRKNHNTREYQEYLDHFNVSANKHLDLIFEKIRVFIQKQQVA